MSFRMLHQWEEVEQKKTANYPFYKRTEQNFVEAIWLLGAA
jgi:hypothetical protein